MTRWLFYALVFSLVAAPVIAYAAVGDGGGTSVSSIVLHLINTACNTFLVGEIPAIKRRIGVLEQRKADHDEGILR